MDGIVEFHEIIEHLNRNDESQGVAIRYVRYPESQQVNIWLDPSDFVPEARLNLVRTDDGAIVLDEKIDKLRSGSSKISLDSYSWPLGEYELRILNAREVLLVKFTKRAIKDNEFICEYDSGVCTTASINQQKQERMNAPFQKQEDDETMLTEDKQSNDPEADLKVRKEATEQSIKEQESRNSHHSETVLLYHENGRSGEVEYIEANWRHKFWYEFAGGDCKLFIDIPTEADWELHTGIPLIERRKVLLFIASKVIQEKAPSWRYEIHDREIAFY